jgi:hypothetical protein
MSSPSVRGQSSNKLIQRPSLISAYPETNYLYGYFQTTY